MFKHNLKEKSGREGFGDGLLKAGEENKNVVALTADLKDSTKVNKFAEKFPDRFFDVGVAEQNMAGIAAGLALSGKIPVMTSFGVFSPGRNWDQIRVSICYSKANVKIASSHLGLGNGPDGATHQALEDIALTRVLPNLTVLSPADYEETKKAIEHAIKHIGPVYIRYARPDLPIFTTEKTPFEIGKAQKLVEGEDITLVATGPSVYEALKACKKLLEENKISCEVINLSTIKPLDEKTILESVNKTKKVVTVEEHQIHGGMGSAVSEVLAQKMKTHFEMKILGVEDTFAESGDYIKLRHKYKVDEHAIVEAIKNLVK